MAKRSEPQIAIVALEGISNILGSGESLSKAQKCENFYVKMLEEAGGLAVLRALSSDLNSEIASKAINILNQFFQGSRGL